MIVTPPVSVNLMALPTKLSRTCVNPTLIATPERQSGSHLSLKCELLVGGQWPHRTIDAVHDVFHRIIIERDGQLPGFDLGQVEHVVDEPEQVFAIRGEGTTPTRD